MATSLFKLVGSVFVDTDEANKSLQKTSENAEKTGTSFGAVAGKAAAVGTAVVAAAGAAVTGIVSLASNAATTADELDKMSIRMGISAENLQEYQYAAELAGVSTSTLEQAAKALEGTDMNFDEAINQIMALETAEERSAMAAELFGEKVAYNMSPLIEQSAESFAAARQEAEDLGLVMSNDTVKSGAALNDSFTKVKESIQAIVTKLGASLMPVVQKVADYIVQNMPKIQELFDKLAPIFTELFDQLVPPLMELVDELLPELLNFIEMIAPFLGQLAADIIPIIVQLLQTFLPIIIQIVEAILPPLLSIIEALLPIIQIVMKVLTPILNLVVALITPIAGLLSAFGPLIEVMVKLIDLCLIPIMPLIELLAQALEFVLGGAIDGITWVIENVLVKAFEWIAEKAQWLADNWGDIWDGIAEKIKTVFEKIKEFIKTPINWIIEKINGVFKALGEITVPDWVPGIGGTTFSLPVIPTLADGGLLDEGQMFVAREAGPELVGSFNGRSAVMNNDQIVQAVSAGVAKAVSAVFGNSNGNREIIEALNNLTVRAYISGDEVFEEMQAKSRQYNRMTGDQAFI